MSHVVKAHEAPNPANVRLLRPSTSMSHAKRPTHLCKEFRTLVRVRFNVIGRSLGHRASFGGRDQPIVNSLCKEQVFENLGGSDRREGVTRLARPLGRGTDTALSG
jgi:hypothetical protein